MSKKVFIVLLFVCLAALSVMSCKQDLTTELKVSKPEMTNEHPDFSDLEDKLETSSAKALLLHINYLYDTVDVLVENGLDVPVSEEGARDSGIPQGATIDMTDLLRFMPTSRSAEDEEKLNLQLQEVADNYSDSLTNLVPDYSSVEEKGLLNINTEENSILISEDEAISLNSLSGIMTIEIANMIAEGKQLEEALDIIQTDMNKVLTVVEPETSRGLYTDRVPRWTNGKVLYAFGDGLSDDAKEAIETAMKTWEEKTDYCVNFIEVDKRLPFLSVVVISGKTLPAGIAGQSTVGRWSTSKIEFDESKWSPISTPLHELGHTLGLRHEHQRPDRNNYIVPKNTDDKVNYGIFRDWQVCHQKYFTWECVTVKVLWWYVDIYYPVLHEKYWIEDYTRMVGNFDFQSIMLYSGFEVKEAYWSKENCKYLRSRPYTVEKDGKYKVIDTSIKDWRKMSFPPIIEKDCVAGEEVQRPIFVTKYNQSLSPNDIQAVKNLYAVE